MIAFLVDFGTELIFTGPFDMDDALAAALGSALAACLYFLFDVFTSEGETLTYWILAIAGLLEGLWAWFVRMAGADALRTRRTLDPAVV
jgi:hypothetical protein